MKNQTRLIFDIETAPDHSIPDTLLPQEEDMKVGNVKDEEKRKKAVEEKMAKAYSKMGLTPLTGKIIAIGYQFDIDEPEVLAGDDEAKLLRQFFEKIKNRYTKEMVHTTVDLVTFNGKSFDFPYLAVAAARHGLALPLRYDVYSKKYGFEHRDLKMMLADTFGQTGTLSEWVTRFGGTPPKGSGKEVYDLYVTGQWDKIVEHCKGDIEATDFLDSKILNSWY